MNQVIKRIASMAGVIVIAVASLSALQLALHSMAPLQASPLESAIANNSAKVNDTLPVTGALLGLVTDLEQLDALNDAVGKKPSVIKIYQDFSHAGFWDNFADFIDNRGAIEFLSLDPRTMDGEEVRDLNACEVLSGDYDSQIITFATEIKAWGKPLLVSTAGEMNGDWPGWAGAKNFGPDCTQTFDQATDLYGHYGCTDTTKIECADGPERYRDVYRHIYDTFSNTVGVTNVTWVWVVNHESFPNETIAPWNVMTNYYPGDNYVDVISVDGFNWGDPWKTFDQIFSETLTSLSITYPTKALILGEFASAEDDNDPTRKAEWITDAYASIKSDWPQIKIAVWYNSSVGGGSTFPITSTSASTQAYSEAISDPHFIGVPGHIIYIPLVVHNKPLCTKSGNGGTETIQIEPQRTIRGVHIDLEKRRVFPNGQQHGFSLWEVEIYGPGTSDLAIGATAKASSSQDNTSCSGCSPDKAVDGNINTRWGSEFYEPQWFEITLPESQIVSRIVLKWENAYATEYCITMIE